MRTQVKYFFLLFFSLIGILLKAQPTLYPSQYIPVQVSGTYIQNPWTGGINSAQPQLIDLDNNGILDLAIYEKSENKVLTFINSASGGSAPLYTFRPEYSKYFPVPNSWMICKDYGCDGITDFFTYGELGEFDAYTGNYIEDTIHFTFQQKGAYYSSGESFINVYASNIDKPSFIDVNGDGDLDYISFNVGGTNFQYYENLRLELSLPCDSLFFDFYHPCWGYMLETGLNIEVILNDTCSDAPTHRVAKTLHVGSASDVADINGDGHLDVLLGDISLNILNYLKNGSSSPLASFIEQDIHYPSYDVPLMLDYFPAPFVLDINQDGRKDLLVSPFDGVGGNNINNLWYYRNTSDDSLLLRFQQKNYLTDNMLDFGEWAKPCIVDVDGDGLKDVLIANGGIRVDGYTAPAQIILLKNIGELDYPRFSLIDSNFLSLKSLNTPNLSISASDYDNDGDEDLIVGLQNGTLLTYQNQEYTFITKGYIKDNANAIIDVGQDATPCWADLNGDGKKDLIIGERNGNINYYTCSDYSTLQYLLVTDSLGKISTRTPLIPYGYSSPTLIDLDADGHLDLVTGSVLDTIYFFSHIGNYIHTLAFATKKNILPSYLGYRLHPIFSDLTQDGKMECLVGSFSGGVYFYSAAPPDERPLSLNDNWKNDIYIFPIPSKDIITIHGIEFPVEYSISDAYGQILSHNIIKDNTLNLEKYPSGIYIITFYSRNGTTSKIIIKA